MVLCLAHTKRAVCARPSPIAFLTSTQSRVHIPSDMADGNEELHPLENGALLEDSKTLVCHFIVSVIMFGEMNAVEERVVFRVCGQALVLMLRTGMPTVQILCASHFDLLSRSKSGFCGSMRAVPTRTQANGRKT